MPTITFKVDDTEARLLRAAARRAKLTLSEFIRRRVRNRFAPTNPIRLVECPLTGAMIFRPAPQHPPLTTETVKEMLAEFP